MVLLERKGKVALSVHDFVDIEYSRFEEPVEKIISMAKRHNNPKRDFLFVNHLLGKHIEVSGEEVLATQAMLYEEVVDAFTQKGWLHKKVLIVGFAETATGLAQGLMYQASVLDSKKQLNVVGYTQTTREKLLDNEFTNIAFQEEHSHATDQKLYFDPALDYDVVVFVEDEITTGKTILNFIEQFEKHQPGKEYAVASILNWQNDKDSHTFKEKAILTSCLVRGKMKKELQKFSSMIGRTFKPFDEANYYVSLPKENNPRLPMTAEQFVTFTTLNLNKVNDLRKQGKKTLVIGTEENMFIPTLIAEAIGADVKATTRSPIEPIQQEDYPIQSRVMLNSAYDSERVTYLYNMDLGKYDNFIVVMEKACPFFKGQMTLLLQRYGTVTIINQKEVY